MVTGSTNMFVLPRILHTMLAAFLGCAGVCAQEKEKIAGLTEEESRKLAALSFRYDFDREEITRSQLLMPMDKLRQGYRERMRKLQDRFSKAGDLPKALAAQAAAKEDPTIETVDAEIKEIAEAQQIFIDSKRKFEKRRDESHEKLARSFITRLTGIKRNLTVAGRLESAFVIEQQIKNIMLRAGAPPATSVKVAPQVLANFNPVSDFEWKSIRGKVAITGFLGDGPKVVIPNRIDEKPVTSIGDRAFFECKRLTSITIPDGVTSIGISAFLRCSGLTSITIPDSVTLIEQEAFLNCTGLKSITIGNSVTSIGRAAFVNCNGLTSITFGENSQLGRIGNEAFLRCSSLTSITLGDSIKRIEDKAFSECTRLTAVTFLGDEPKVTETAFQGALSTIYRKAEAKGWGDTLAGRPVKLISEKP